MRATAAATIFLISISACRGETTNPLGQTPAVIAHRGSSYAAPEHTIAAYDLALAEGADYIEQDIARTFDGVLVVLHDATLDRTARGPAASCTGAVRDKSLAQIRQCDVGSWFNAAYPERARSEYAGLRIPTLEEVLIRYRGRAGFYIEIKDPNLYPGIENQLLLLLESNGLPLVVVGSPPFFIQSFSAESLQRVRAIEPFVATIQLLLSTESSQQIRSALPAIAAYATGIAPSSANTDASLVRAARDLCLFVHPWTADTPFEISRLLDMGVDGIFTDRPQVMRSLAPAAAGAEFQVCRAEK